ncbi:MAG: aldo/keto reductase [Candidatus Bathyarchaeota archaeon]|nr:MAG: aldo/keto reductase [Candidatus Bathyarchaeota archaeon]
MIPKIYFGRTGHASTRVIFGSWALSKATQAEADRVLELLLEFGVNHIDTAPMYGNAEKCIGSWMKQHRKNFFLATKSRRRTHEGALEDLQRSLGRLKVDYIDLWQLHGLTNQGGWEKAMGPEGALKAFIEARDKGLVRFLGVTGHGAKAPAMLKPSLERFDFDAVMFPYNYPLMQDVRYEADFNELISLCCEHGAAVQTMKCLARWPCRGQSKTYNTYFYEPLVAQEAIDKAVHWSLGLTDSFLMTVGDMQLLPKMLDAANRFEKRPSEAEMQVMVDEFTLQPIFFRPQRKGSHTWGYQMSQALEVLMREEFFKYPNKRTLESVVKSLESLGLSTHGRKENIARALANRTTKGRLKKTKLSNQWIYWTE